MICVAVSSSLFAEDLKRRDFEVVEEFLNSKRTIPTSEKANNLTISGDVRFKWRHLCEKVNSDSHLGGNNLSPIDGTPLGRNRFDVDLDLYFDYVADRAWGVAWIEFNNTAGQEINNLTCAIDPQQCGGSGECGDLCLRKAYMGYNLIADGCTRLDIELGRRPMWTVFDSRIQFGSRFDGLLVRFSHDFECWADFYVNVGAFVVDERVDHFSYVVEAGLLDIMDYGFDLKYSFIYWPKTGSGWGNACKVVDPRGFQFKNSQVTLYYNFNPELFCRPAQLYGAVLYNAAAKSSNLNGLGLNNQRIRKTPNYKNEGLGWYVGLLIGEVRVEGDWSIDIDYEYVEPQAVMECDLSSDNARINAYRESFNLTGRGYGNYKGWRFEGLYALTDNLVFDTIVEFCRAADKNVGGQYSASRFRLEALYAF